MRENPKRDEWSRITYDRKNGSPEEREARKAAKARERKQHAAARRDVQLARAKAYRTQNRTKVLALQKAWRDANRDKIRADKRAREIRKRKALVASMMSSQHGRCGYCQCDLRKLPAKKVHVDHILPRSLGGTNERRNLHLTCEPCNLSKNATPHEKFVLRFGRLI